MRDRRIAVLATNALTRNLTQFSINGLYEAMLARWQNGVPSTVSHDVHRPIGWTWPFAIHLEPGLVRLLGVTELLEDDDDRSHLLAGYAAYLARKNDEETRDHEPRLKELLAPHLDGTETSAYVTIASMVSRDLARRVFPDIFTLEDGDGLVPLNALTPLAPGVYRKGELALVAHAYFRRSLSRQNNLNHDLLRALEVADETKDTIVRVRLDPDVVGLASSFLTPIELQYWYGPKFSSDVARIPPGVARHEADDRQRFFHAISRTEFWWQSRDGEHILEAEEIRDIPTFGKEDTLYGCRYVHSMVDEATGNIHHLDGAIREYTEEEMVERLEYDIAAAGRRSMYTKLWRVDGRIDVPSMKTLVHHHFRDNTLVGEYLEGREVKVVDDGQPEPAARRSARSRLVPYSMRRGNGVQLMLAYHPTKVDVALPGDRVVVPYEHVDASGAVHPCVPHNVVEFRKVLSRDGEALLLPPDMHVIGYNDLYSDFPLVRHANHKAIEGTLAALRILVATWKRLGQDRCVTVSLSVHSQERETVLSVAGHVDDMDSWLRGPAPFPPEDVELHGAWLETMAESLPLAPREDDGHPQLPLLSDAGMLVFERERLARSDYELVPTDGGLVVKLLIDNNDVELIEAIASGALSVKLAYLISSSTCTKCRAEYRECPCIKLVDSGAQQRIGAMKIMFAFWTDRPAEAHRPVPTPPP